MVAAATESLTAQDSIELAGFDLVETIDRIRPSNIQRESGRQRVLQTG